MQAPPLGWPRVASAAVTAASSLTAVVAATASIPLTASPGVRFAPQPTRDTGDRGCKSANQFTVIGIRRLGAVDPELR